jgi:ribose transport system permease protein
MKGSTGGKPLQKVFDMFKKSQTAGVFGVLIVIMIASSLISNKFLTAYNIQILVRSLAFSALVALGQGLMLLLGDIDLSVGSIAGLCGVIVFKLGAEMGVNPYVAILIGLVCGIILGLTNGFLITTFKLNPLVLTIGTQTAFRGINMVITKGKTIIGFPKEVAFLGQGSIFNEVLPIPAIILMVIFIMMFFLTQKTTFGRNVYAVGNSQETAKMVGIKTDQVRIISYGICGFLASVAGILMCMRLASAMAAIGEVWVMPSIAAPVIGGIATTGGIGSISGALVGGGIIAVVQNIIVLGNVNLYWQQVINGCIVIVAIVIDSVARKFRSKL